MLSCPIGVRHESHVSVCWSGNRLPSKIPLTVVRGSHRPGEGGCYGCAPFARFAITAINGKHVAESAICPVQLGDWHRKPSRLFVLLVTAEVNSFVLGSLDVNERVSVAVLLENVPGVLVGKRLAIRDHPHFPEVSRNDRKTIFSPSAQRGRWSYAAPINPNDPSQEET